MKEIVAIVKPFRAETVLKALADLPVEACTISAVKGFGRQKSYLDRYAGSEFATAFLPKVRIAVWVEDERVEEVCRRIVSGARTGRIGDGKVFVLPLFEGGSVDV